MSLFANVELPGIDLRNGLEQIGNSETSYLRFLRSFYGSLIDYRTNFAKLKHSTDYPELRRITHQLYGVTSMIGATGLATQCEKIISTTNHNTTQENIDTLLSNLLDELEIVRAGSSALPDSVLSNNDDQQPSC